MSCPEALVRLGLVSERALAETYVALLGHRLAGPERYPDEPVLPEQLRPRFLRAARTWCSGSQPLPRCTVKFWSCACLTAARSPSTSHPRATIHKSSTGSKSHSPPPTASCSSPAPPAPAKRRRSTPLLSLNTVERKIITVEDPIEYQLSGINQIQVKPQIDLGFASLLRSIVRLDSDVIMVGEIRDLETAESAARAALTGHLALSTLHTNSAAAAITRLRDMGLPAKSLKWWVH